MSDDIYIIYSRKSKFTGRGESIENQIDMCKNYLLSKYGNILEKIVIFQDEGFTGYNTNRPQFQEMMKVIRNKKVRCVIVYRLDRISRNVADFCHLKEVFSKYNVSFISVTENFDTTTPMGVAMLMISSVFAQLERDTIAERIRDNMYELAKSGRWLGGTTPLGFKSRRVDSIDLDGKKRSLYKLESVDDEVEKVKVIWDKMSELKGLSKLESCLLEMGFKTRNNNSFTRFSLRDIFRNPVYVIADMKIKKFFEDMGVTIYAEECDFDGKMGLIAFNKRLEVSGKCKVMRDVKEWIIAVGKHNGIVSSDKFIEIWNILDNNKDKRFRKPPSNTSILSGIIRCKRCGSLMRPRLRESYDSSGERNFFYLCELKDKSRKKLCDCKNIRGIYLDRLVISEIKKLIIPTGFFIDCVREKVNGSKSSDKRRKKELQKLKASLSKNKLKIDCLIDKLAIIDKDIIDEVSLEIKSLKLKNAEILSNISVLESDDEEINWELVNELACEVINCYMDSFDNLDLIEKRMLVKLLISSVVVDEREIYINYIDRF